MCYANMMLSLVYAYNVLTYICQWSITIIYIELYIKSLVYSSTSNITVIYIIANRVCKASPKDTET